MVKKGININIQKKDLFLILAIGIFVIGVGFVIAYNSSPPNPAVFGHTADEIEGLSAGGGQTCVPSNTQIFNNGDSSSSSPQTYSGGPAPVGGLDLSADTSYHTSGSSERLYINAYTRNSSTDPYTLTASDSYLGRNMRISISFHVDEGGYYKINASAGELTVYQGIVNCYPKYSVCSWTTTLCANPPGYFGYVCPNGGVMKGLRFRDANANCGNDYVAGSGGDSGSQRQVDVYCCY